MGVIKAGTILSEEGQNFYERYLIMKGTVKAENAGCHLVLRAGDIVGLCEANYNEAFFTYQVESDLSVFPLPGKQSELRSALEKNKDAVRYVQSSLFRQINDIGSRCRLLKVEVDNLWQYLESCYDSYKVFCREEASEGEILPGYEELQKPEFKDAPPEWMQGYYATLEQMMSIWDHNNTDMDFVYGFVMKGSNDMQRMILYCKEAQAFREELCNYLINEDGVDLFGMFSNLYLGKMEEGNVASEKLASLKMKIQEMVSVVQRHRETEADYCQKRIEEFERNVMELENQNNEKGMDNVAAKEALEAISGSLDKILKYAECGEHVEANFKRYILAYKKLQNKNSTEEVARLLRHEITALFYKIYIAAFQVSIRDHQVPTIIKMFFNFGYVDEELAGVKNAVYLYWLAKNMPTNPEKGVYSMYEWMMAIYIGKREPGRNEFDMDYGDYLREQRKMGRISEAQEKTLINNNASRVMYELENVFPSVNKISFGRPSTFCPVFSKHNALKALDAVLVTEQKVTAIMDTIRSTDYGAFYRETMLSEPDKGIPKEIIQVEVLPDVILAPNMGTRGVMWQEVEGKKRNTPARMICSVFEMEDLELTIIRMTAEFRWEMCKRIQGGRWNDVSERSLTSEYCDYAQFYKKNKDLSADTKERIKVQLLKARNNFKEMFISDYIVWVRYESAGSPRLNKPVRNIMFTYCPFPKTVTTKLLVNPLYKEFVDKHGLRRAQKLHHVENVCKKLQNLGKPIPEEYEKYKQFLEA